MLKHLIVAAAVFTLGLGSALAAEMSLPGSAVPSAAAAETDIAVAGARDDSFGSAMHASTQRGADAAHPRLQPDAAAAEPRSEAATHTFPSGDAMSGAEASQRRHHTHWQSLLPGVMK